ncbi:MAG TPA: mechanosensitive ion channel family protein [Solirubrobacteraceae bacterium]|nr:mechanosensitive ion channel family protein [Solirubrobacteraceae bacterium]
MAALIVAAETASERYITAGLTLLAAVVLVVIVDRALRGRTRKIAEALGGGAVVDTRLRFLRRLVEAAIVIIGLALAISEFTSLDRFASTVLASSAIAAAVIGFASRQVLANAIAGMVLAVTQPVRVGDLVTIEGETGTVEDVTLTYTWLRTGSDARLIIPNERLAAGMLRNDSIRSPLVALEVSAWIAPDADETVALAALQALEDARSARIAEITDTGIRVVVGGPPVAPAERIAREGDLRAEALRALREAGCRGPRDEP